MSNFHQVRIFLLSGQNVDILCAKFALEGRMYVARDSESPIPAESRILAIFAQDRVAGYLLVDPQREIAERIHGKELLEQQRREDEIRHMKEHLTKEGQCAFPQS